MQATANVGGIPATSRGGKGIQPLLRQSPGSEGVNNFSHQEGGVACELSVIVKQDRAFKLPGKHVIRFGEQSKKRMQIQNSGKGTKAIPVMNQKVGKIKKNSTE